MTVEAFRALRERVAHVPALARFRLVFARPAHRTTQHLTVDRKDPDSGYAIDNICKACVFCVFIKNGLLREDQMRHLGPQVHEELARTLT